jgi:hypothetical protein
LPLTKLPASVGFSNIQKTKNNPSGRFPGYLESSQRPLCGDDEIKFHASENCGGSASDRTSVCSK